MLQLGNDRPLISIILFLTFGNECSFQSFGAYFSLAALFPSYRCSVAIFRDEDAKGDDGDGEEEDGGNVVNR